MSSDFIRQGQEVCVLTGTIGLPPQWDVLDVYAEPIHALGYRAGAIRWTRRMDERDEGLLFEGVDIASGENHYRIITKEIV